MKEENYNIATLSPNNKEEKKLFSTFRKTDVESMFTYMCIFTTCFAVGFAFVFIRSQTFSNFIQLLLALVRALLHWLIYAIGRKVKHKLVYMIAVLFVTEQILIALTFEWLKEEEGRSVNYHLMFRMTSFCVIYALLLAPSIYYIWICYIPAFFINVV